jgi:hypothetical protein
VRNGCIFTGGGRNATIFYACAGILLLKILKSQMPFPPLWESFIKIPKIANLDFDVWYHPPPAVFYKFTRLFINIKPH